MSKDRKAAESNHVEGRWLWGGDRQPRTQRRRTPGRREGNTMSRRPVDFFDRYILGLDLT